MCIYFVRENISKKPLCFVYSKENIHCVANIRSYFPSYLGRVSADFGLSLNGEVQAIDVGIT